MRLIDADALLTFMRKGWRVFPSSELRHTCDITDVENAPTIDAVPVVRCKDCKFYTEDEKWCRRLGLCGAFNENDFCSHGERMTLD